ncbi:MAG: M81 family metallopeptidase [Ruminococcaceae bacterium]|nr:M81 family metallopeptidase [Oscillospiraceae bacterium]
MKKNVLTITFSHETNAFCPKKTDIQDFRNMYLYVGEEAFTMQRGRREGVGAFLEVFEGCDDFTLIPTLSAWACPSGVVTANMYDFALNQIETVIHNHKNIDGVLLNLHGAMVAEGHDDGEGDLLEWIRNLVGWEIPVIASLDLHANVTDKMAKCATALIPCEEYPHTDTYETYTKAAELMLQTLRGECKPVMAYRKIPFLQPLLPSASAQLAPLYALTEELKKQQGILSARFTHGFFPSDIAELGMAVLIVADGNQQQADAAADALYRLTCQQLPNLKITYPSFEETLDRIMAAEGGPYVIADSSDNPGAGGLGDTTHILRAILQRGITGAALATITDAKAVETCIVAGVGATVELELGGWSDAEYSGGPLKVSAYVKLLSDGKYLSKAKMSYNVEFRHGKTAVVEIAGNSVIITEISRQPYDIEIFPNHGIDPKEQKLIVVKSSVHYRATFASVAKEMITVALPGYSVPIPQIYKYKKWKGSV